MCSGEFRLSGIVKAHIPDLHLLITRVCYLTERNMEQTDESVSPQVDPTSASYLALVFRGSVAAGEQWRALCFHSDHALDVGDLSVVSLTDFSRTGPLKLLVCVSELLCVHMLLNGDVNRCPLDYGTVWPLRGVCALCALHLVS